jgi:hypothetical protein
MVAAKQRKQAEAASTNEASAERQGDWLVLMEAEPMEATLTEAGGLTEAEPIKAGPTEAEPMGETAAELRECGRR